MSAEPDTTSGAADPTRSTARTRVTHSGFLNRVSTRLAWREEPVVRLRYIPYADALIVDLLPLPPMADRIVDDLLCIEFDGDDPEALPTAMCLTAFTARPDSPAARSARHILGKTIWDAGRELVLDGVAEGEVLLDPAVRDSRVRVWRRLTGIAVGIEIQPGELRAVLVGADGEIIAVARAEQAKMDLVSVVAGIASLVTEIRSGHRAEIAGSPLVVGVQIGGPVDPDAGVVHYFKKRGRRGEPGWGWLEEPLADLVIETISLPVHVLNDVVAYATYERWFHPAPDERCRAVLLISQGIGAKLVINGTVATQFPMEIGNIVLDEKEGRPCDCGKRGCLEATAGTLAIVEQIHEITGMYVDDVQQAVRIAEADGADVDEGIIDIFRAAGRDLAQGIGTVQAIANPSSWAIYGPEALITKGSVAGEAFLENLDSYDKFVAYKPYQQCDVRRRPIMGDEGAHGAALAALEWFEIARPDSVPADQPAG